MFREAFPNVQERASVCIQTDSERAHSHLELQILPSIDGYWLWPLYRCFHRVSMDTSARNICTIRVEKLARNSNDALLWADGAAREVMRNEGAPIAYDGERRAN